MSGTHDESHLDRITRERYLDGELAARELEAAERHLDGCARCRDEVESFRVLFRELDALPVPEAPRGFDVRVLDAVLPRPVEASAFFRLATRAYALLTALMVTVLGTAFLVAGPSGIKQSAVSGFTAAVGFALGSARAFGVGFVDLIKTLGDLGSVADAAGTLARGLETAVGAALPPQVLLPLVLTLVLASLVLAWALNPARERGVPNVCLSL